MDAKQLQALARRCAEAGATWPSKADVDKATPAIALVLEAAGLLSPDDQAAMEQHLANADDLCAAAGSLVGSIPSQCGLKILHPDLMGKRDLVIGARREYLNGLPLLPADFEVAGPVDPVHAAATPPPPGGDPSGRHAPFDERDQMAGSADDLKLNLEPEDTARPEPDGPVPCPTCHKGELALVANSGLLARCGACGAGLRLDVADVPGETGGE